MHSGKMPSSGSSLDKLLKAWGLSLDVGKVVADVKYMLPVGGPNQHAPAILGLSGDALNEKDILTAQIENVWFPLRAPLRDAVRRPQRNGVAEELAGLAACRRNSWRISPGKTS